jgi:porphobilinogen synthase
MIRPRRLRQNPIIREMVAETRLSKNMFIYPYFVVPGTKKKEAINAMPGINHFSVDTLLKDAEEGLKLGINKILLFGTGDLKSEKGNSSSSKDSIVAKAIRALKKEFGEELFVITDVCLCAYTTHGHCGILEEGHVHNDSSVEALASMALAHAQAGADMVAPSDMMDGRVMAIREMLDENKFDDVSIMSYAVKFASAYYGPFREAAGSSPQKGDRKSYQMDFRNGREAMKEALLDEAEGADILMVKPALAYLDVIRDLRQQTLLPVACYNVSGEYSMVKLAAKNKLIDERSLVLENMHAFARAGADIIISYHTKDILKNKWL